MPQEFMEFDDRERMSLDFIKDGEVYEIEPSRVKLAIAREFGFSAVAIELKEANDHRRASILGEQFGYYNEYDFTVNGYGYTVYFNPLVIQRNYHIDENPNEFTIDTSALGGE